MEHLICKQAFAEIHTASGEYPKPVVKLHNRSFLGVAMKKVVSAAVFLVLIFSLYKTFAREAVSLDLTGSMKTLLVNNLSYKRLVKLENDAHESYKNAVREADNIEDDGSVYKGRIKYLVPRQREDAWLTAVENRKALRDSLYLSLRQKYLLIYNSSVNLKLQNKNLGLASLEYDKKGMMYESGIISPINMEEAKYGLMESKHAFFSAQRGFENTSRSLNLFLGVDTKFLYDSVLMDETRYFPLSKAEGYFISHAVKNRKEIKQLARRIENIKNEMKIMERKQQHQIIVELGRQYAELGRSLERTFLQLERAKIDIEEEVRSLYADLVSKGKGLEIMLKSLNLQKDQLKQMKARYEAGYISEFTLEQKKLAMEQAEYGYLSELFVYNTLRLELDMAIR